MMRTTYRTRNSTYVVEDTADGMRVKREGPESLFPHRLAEAGVWHAVEHVGPYFDGLAITFPDGASTLTSSVVSKDAEAIS